MRSRNGEFGIFPRRSRKTVFYYYWIYDKDGNRKYRSTGKQDYNEALKYCRSMQIKGQLYIGTSYSFDAYTKDFFVYGICPYISYRLLRGYSYGKTWAKKQRSLLQKIIQPYFCDTDIRAISSKKIDEFMLRLRQEKTGAKTLNHVLTALKAIFGYAKKTGAIDINPAEGVKQFNIALHEKGIFSREELVVLFNTLPEFSGIWKDSIHFLLNYIAVTTGLRLGEILALRPENITETTIIVEHSWNRIEGLKGTKTGKTRIVPISVELGKALGNFIMNHNINGFLFSANKGLTPMDHKAVYRHFWHALSEIGISKEARKKRNLSFHSYRHTFNTMLLEAGINPETIRLITGHSINMTARYSHIQLSNMPEITEKLLIIKQPLSIAT
jgi:integrase